jgi:hypothetical protein
MQPSACATGIHMDWTEAVNVAFAITDVLPHADSERLHNHAIQLFHGPDAALALWVFFTPSMVALGTLSAWLLKKRGKECLKVASGEKTTLSIDEVHDLMRDHPGLVRLEFQKAGDRICVPPGWAHQVLNLRPNLKVAWERVRRDRLALYSIQLDAITLKHFGKMAPDYVAIRQVLFAELKAAHAEFLRRTNPLFST